MPLLTEDTQNSTTEPKIDSSDLSPQSRTSLGHLPTSEHHVSPLFAAHNQQLVERCVLVAKQNDGYGLTVSGDHPVFVNTVKPDGAAFRAGVRQGDRILKINGMPVTSSNHTEVVRMISGGHNVALTLLGRPPVPISFAMPMPLSYSKRTEENSYSHRRERSDSKSAACLSQIIEPIFEVEDENYQQKQIFAKELIQMLRREKNNLECLQENPNLQGSSKLDRALQKISHLQLQLNSIDPSFFFRERLGNAFPPNNNNSSVEQQQQQLPSSVKSWVDSGGMHYVQAIADVVPLGESDEEEEDLAVIEDSGPFSNLLDLKSRPAHLAVFISYLLNNSNPSSLLFYLISDSYQSNGSTKELRRFAYEIFSTFLIPSAPLQISDISQPLIQQIDKVLRAAAANNSSQDIDQLKKLFLPARTRAVGEINELLADFRQKRQLGVGVDHNLLDTIARADHATEMRIAEQLLFRILESLMHSAGTSNNTTDCLENCEPKTLALIMSVATIIRVVLNLKSSNSAWEKLIEKCPTFMTTQKSISMLSKMKPKRTIQIKDHQFSLNPVNLTVHCYQCRDAIWGVNAQAYFCSNCDVIVHKQCASKLADHCYPAGSNHQQQKERAKSSSGAPLAQNKISSGKPSKATSSSTSLHQVGIQSSTLPHYSNLQQQQPVHHRSNNRISDSCSVGSHDQHHVIGSHSRPSHSSASLTPPMHRAHAVLGSGIGAQMKLVSSGSRLEFEEDACDALIDHMQSPPGGGTAGHKAQNNTLSSSPASSTSMLPPPVFSQKFERIAEPPPIPSTAAGAGMSISMTSPEGDGPPMSPPPPVPPSSNIGALKVVSGVVAVEHNVKSMSSDSGIGTDVVTMIMGDGKAHPVSRAHSMKIEQPTTTDSPSSQIRRNGRRGVCSMGAADTAGASVQTATLGVSPLAEETSSKKLSAGVEQVRNYHSSSTLTVGRSSDASSSSAVDVTAMAMTMTPSFGGGSDSVSECPAATTSNFMAQSPALIRAIELSAGLGSATGSSSGPSSINEEEHRLLMERAERTVIVADDSDLEVETEVPSLESLVSWEVLRHLKPKDKKRQEVINELFHTERTHVRNLKILYQVFYRPLVVQQFVPAELIKLLFGNLDDLLEVHLEMHRKMKLAREMWRREGASEGLYGDIGELLEGMFDGVSGERLMKATALFCQNQQHALDTLRARYNRAKDDPLSNFLVEAESNPLCRKLQLKDMIPVEMQRLVKYPLLLETIAKYTKEPSEELSRLLNTVNCAKKILSAVNSAKRNAENLRRLDDIQKRLDFSPDKSGSGITSGAGFFQKFDFRQHRLIYEGPLTWRQSRGKTVELQVVLLEHLLVFLTKSADGTKLQLKVHEAGCIPIMKLAAVEVEEKSNDKRAFNLLYKSDLRLFELVAATATERKTWHRLIENQVAVTRQDMPGDACGLFDTVSTSPSTISFNSPYKVARSTIVGQEDGVGGGQGGSLAKIEQVHVMTHPTVVGLVNAAEITVQQPKILEHAQPIVTQADRLTRNDKMIVNALVDKHNILAELLKEQNKGNPEELERISEMMTGLSVAELKQRSSKELAMSAIVHGNRLLDSINKGMSAKKEGDKLVLDDSEKHLPSVPCYKLTAVAAPLMNHLKALMQVIQDQEMEIGSLKQEVVKARDSNGPGGRTMSEETLLDNTGSGTGGARMVLRSS